MSISKPTAGYWGSLTPLVDQFNNGDGALSTALPTALSPLLAALATRTQGPRRIVFAGSSTTEGLNATTAANRYVNRLVAAIQAAYPSGLGGESAVVASTSASWGTPTSSAGIHGYNAGEAGTTAADYLTAGEITNIAGLNPAAVIHMIGANDFVNDVAIATYKTNVQAALTALKAAITVPCVHILVQTYERMDDTGANAWADYGTALAEIAAADPTNVVYLDLSAYYTQLGVTGVGGADPLNLIDTDNIHQNDAGHAYMAELLARLLGIPGRVAPAVAGGGSGTDPETLTGLLASFRADDLALADTAAVASWSPHAGSETAAMAQATGGSQPIYRTGRVNGRPAVVFTAASSHNLDSGAWGTSHAVPITMFVVGKRTTGNDGNLFTGRSGVFVYLGSGSGSSGMSGGAGATDEFLAPWTQDEFRLIGVVYDGSASAYYSNTKTPTTVTTGTSANAALPGLRLGTNSSAGGGFLDGEIAEVVAFGRALTNTEVGQVMDWLATKYAITLS